MKIAPKELLRLLRILKDSPFTQANQLSNHNYQNIMIEMKEEFGCQKALKMDQFDKEGQVSTKTTDTFAQKNDFKIKKKKSKKRGDVVVVKQQSGDDQNGAQLAKCLINFRVAVDDNAQMIAQLLSPLGNSFIKQFLSEQETPLLITFLRKLTDKQAENAFTVDECKNVQIQANQVFDKCYSSVFSRLSEREWAEYDIISAEYESIKDSDEQWQRKPKKHMQSNEVSSEKMFKLDILSLFLLKGYQYQQLFVRFGVTKIGMSQIIRTRLKVTQSTHNYFPKLLNNMLDYVAFNYQEDFKDILSLLCLIEIVFQVCFYGYQRKTLSQKRSRRIMEKHMKKIDLQERKNKVRSQAIKFKFCEIAGFFVKDHVSDDFLRFKKDNILAQLNKIKPQLSDFQKKRHIIKLRVSSKVPLLPICRWYEELIKNPFLRQQELQMYKKMLEPCKWMYLSTNNFYKPIEKLTNFTIQQGKLGKQKNPISIVITQLAFQRLRQCCYYTNMQIQFARRVKKTDPIYIFVYNFNFDRIFRQYKAHNKQSASCSIVIAMKNDQIVFVETTESKISYQKLAYLLINYFKNKTLLYGGIIVIFKNNFNREIEKGTYYKLINTFKSKHNSHVYFTSDPNCFQLSFAICYVIIYALKKQPKEVNQTNFCQHVAEHSTNVVLSLCQNQQDTIKKEQ